MTRGRVRAFVIAVDLLAVVGFVLVFPHHTPGYIVGLSLLVKFDKRIAQLEAVPV